MISCDAPADVRHAEPCVHCSRTRTRTCPHLPPASTLAPPPVRPVLLPRSLLATGAASAYICLAFSLVLLATELCQLHFNGGTGCGSSGASSHSAVALDCRLVQRAAQVCAPAACGRGCSLRLSWRQGLVDRRAALGHLGPPDAAPVQHSAAADDARCAHSHPCSAGDAGGAPQPVNSGSWHQRSVVACMHEPRSGCPCPNTDLHAHTGSQVITRSSWTASTPPLRRTRLGTRTLARSV